MCDRLRNDGPELEIELLGVSQGPGGGGGGFSPDGTRSGAKAIPPHVGGFRGGSGSNSERPPPLAPPQGREFLYYLTLTRRPNLGLSPPPD